MKYRIYGDGEIVHEDEFSAQDGMIPYRDEYAEVIIPDELEAHIVSEENAELKSALSDMLSGWKYIREVHGDLYGVGWDRAQDKAESLLPEHGIDCGVWGDETISSENTEGTRPSSA